MKNCVYETDAENQETEHRKPVETIWKKNILRIII